MKRRTIIIWTALALLVSGLTGHYIWQEQQNIRLISAPPVQLVVGETAEMIFSAANENVHALTSDSQVAYVEIQSAKQGQIICQVTAVAAGSVQLSCEVQGRQSPAFAVSVIDPIANQNTGTAFVASQNGNKYHLPTCTFAKRIQQNNLISFSTETEAAAQGYIPCKQCLGDS